MNDDHADATDVDIADDNVIQRDRAGDPVRDPRMVAMTERESYERVIDGLKIAAEAAAHLALNEPENAAVWARLCLWLDKTRRLAVEVARIGLSMQQLETERPRQAMLWRPSRDRFREGIRQAAGGMRQLAVCFRQDLVWSRMANQLEHMQAKLTTAAKRKTASLILPPGV